MAAVKRFTAVRIDEELLAGLELLRVRDGATPAESIRRAIRAYLATKHIAIKQPAGKRTPRKRKGGKQ